MFVFLFQQIFGGHSSRLAAVDAHLARVAERSMRTFLLFIKIKRHKRKFAFQNGLRHFRSLDARDDSCRIPRADLLKLLRQVARKQMKRPRTVQTRVTLDPREDGTTAPRGDVSIRSATRGSSRRFSNSVFFSII